MTTTTDTLTTPSETVGPETTSPPQAQPPETNRRAAFGWIALILAGIAVAALAFATFTGGDNSDIPPQGFYPEAETYEREAHLEGNARTYSRAAEAREANPDEFLPDSRHVPTS